MGKKKVCKAAGLAMAGVLMVSGAVYLDSIKRADPTNNYLLTAEVTKSPVSVAKLSTQKENKEGVTLHYKWKGSQPHVYYEVKGTKTKMSKPGAPMKNEGNGWYSYTIEDAEAASIVLSVPEFDYTTSEFSREAGEYWYDDEAGWSTETPANYEEPEMVTVEGENLAVEGNLVVHYPKNAMENASIYFWNVMPVDMETSWPGESLAYDEEWYTYSFNGVDKANFLFTNGNDQTEDFSLNQIGEYWYVNGKWTTKNPSEGSSTSKPTPTKPITTAAPSERTDFRDETIYFVMTTRFYDGDSTNNRYCWDDQYYLRSEDNNDPGWRGDFKGLADKLDYIKALGFSSVWITPVVENASGLDYHGYHAYDFSRVDPRYESSGYTYQDFINDAHEKGIKVIQDIVLNHTGNWGEKNLYHMFDRKKDDGSGTTAFMKVSEDKDALTDRLQMGVDMKGRGSSSYDAIQTNESIPKHERGGAEYDSRLAAMKQDKIDTDFIYHHYEQMNYNSIACQLGQMAGDCVDLNTENPTVYNYLTECYNNYIKMGVDGFRIDTVKHISRLTFNKVFNPAFKKTGGDNFYMFGEVCARYNQVINEGQVPLSVFFYTWAEDNKSYLSSWSDSDQKVNSDLALKHYDDYNGKGINVKSDNAFLKGNEYHTPDYSEASGLNAIDFFMHWQFKNAGDAFSAALTEDESFNDSTWNVVYVDSHDYAPDHAPENQRFAEGQDVWAENMSLMFTFRGIPCLYYGSEIEFQKGCCIDPMTTSNGGEGSGTPYKKSGRAYFGDNIEGSVDVKDYGVYSNATGAMAETLNYPLAKHVTRLNLIRRAVPALRKGQYSTDNISGSGMSYKRRYKSNTDDSYVLVNVSGQATFKDVLNGTYVELVTGKSVEVTNGTLSTESVGKGNMRVYVLQNDTARRDGATSKIGEDGTYLK